MSEHTDGKSVSKGRRSQLEKVRLLMVGVGIQRVTGEHCKVS